MIYTPRRFLKYADGQWLVRIHTEWIPQTQSTVEHILRGLGFDLSIMDEIKKGQLCQQ